MPRLVLDVLSPFPPPPANDIDACLVRRVRPLSWARRADCTHARSARTHNRACVEEGRADRLASTWGERSVKQRETRTARMMRARFCASPRVGADGACGLCVSVRAYVQDGRADEHGCQAAAAALRPPGFTGRTIIGTDSSASPPRRLPLTMASYPPQQREYRLDLNRAYGSIASLAYDVWSCQDDV